MMPVMGGFEFCKEVKKDINTSHIPIIMLSAKSTTPEQIEGLTTGADVYITKPFSIEYLKLQISNILQLIEKRHKVVGAGKPIKKKELKLSKRDKEFLDNLNALIESNLDNNQLTNDFLAEKLFVSNSTLYRKCNALTGKGINDYIRFKKLLKSQELIRSGEYSISEIAYMTGFNTPSYFSQCFKKEFGMLPSDFN
jgi:AraC-like DNA-binding protein